MPENYNFEDIRPYYDHEAAAAMQNIKHDPLFMQLINYLWPEMTQEEAFAKALKVTDNMSFQLEFMHQAIRTIVSRSSTGLSCSGFENIDPDHAYLFIANHRDILLDSAILQILLVEHGFKTSEITFGNNLKQGGFITEFGRLNRMFTVIREGNSRELYEISQKLSAYIRHTIVEKNVSVWIAQRNGRTKDGNDLTQSGLLKMLNLSGKKTFSENMKDLKIVPVSISYEYEPCDSLKIQELYLSSLHSKYVKAPGEDFNSIIAGVNQPKGRIHMAIGKPIVSEADELEKSTNENEKIKNLVSFIDEQIYNNYKLWPVNYIAADIASDSTDFSFKYTPEEKENFIKYINQQISTLKGEHPTLFNMFITMYANPVKNKVNQSVTN
ncbi:MAG: glycerol acyltransferase [Bacteroidetes bacterium]|jgi:1-acyl-sn-glycerol-3-phosphate acyltransferase|nr:glycerol acyltransferase [Bacteroidota bacterium]